MSGGRVPAANAGTDVFSLCDSGSAFRNLRRFPHSNSKPILRAICFLYGEQTTLSAGPSKGNLLMTRGTSALWRQTWRLCGRRLLSPWMEPPVATLDKLL